MQLLILVLSRSSAEFGLTIAAIPIVLILLIACGVAVKQEIKWLMTLSIFLMLAAQTYFIYKLVRIFTPSSSDRYVTTRVTLSFFLIVSCVLLLISFGIGLRCLADFDKGLRHPKTNEGSQKPKIQNGTSPAMGERNPSYSGGSALGARMSIE